MVSLFGGKSSVSLNKKNIFNVISKVNPNSAGTLGATDATPLNLAQSIQQTSPIIAKDSLNRLSIQQAAALVSVHDLYSLPLGQKKYETISVNYVQYLALLKTLKTIDLRDPVMNNLLLIAQNSIIGAVNSVAVSTNFSYTKLKVVTLNKYIDDILSDKNVKSALSEGISGNISATKIFNLSPLLSYYIILYGLPLKGVGFDMDKMAFIQSLPSLTITGGINIPIVKLPDSNEYVPVDNSNVIV